MTNPVGENTKKAGVQSCDLHPTRRNVMRNHNHYFDADGHIRAHNLSAYWLPEITLKREIKGTTYTVSGSYEGTQRLDQKLFRIMKKSAESEVASQ
jgi:hypothetical protein